MKTTMTTLGLSNSLAATKERYQWMRIAPLGDHPHPFGIQRLNKNSAQKMIRQFYSLQGIIKRCFAALPIYVGHPDDINFSNRPDHQDKIIYGRIHDLEVRKDGLWAFSRWSKNGQKLIEGTAPAYQYLSPRWVMHHMGDNIFEPRRLISVGLTNQPNIPSNSLCSPASDNNPFFTLTQILGIPYSQTFSAIFDQATILHSLHKKQLKRPLCNDPTMKEKSIHLSSMGCEIYDAALNRPNTKSITQNLSFYTTSPSSFLQNVEEYMKENGVPYTTAWSAVKKQFPHLYEQLSN